MKYIKILLIVNMLTTKIYSADKLIRCSIVRISTSEDNLSAEMFLEKDQIINMQTILREAGFSISFLHKESPRTERVIEDKVISAIAVLCHEKKPFRTE